MTYIDMSSYVMHVLDYKTEKGIKIRHTYHKLYNWNCRSQPKRSPSVQRNHAPLNNLVLYSIFHHLRVFLYIFPFGGWPSPNFSKRQGAIGKSPFTASMLFLHNSPAAEPGVFCFGPQKTTQKIMGKCCQLFLATKKKDIICKLVNHSNGKKLSFLPTLFVFFRSVIISLGVGFSSYRVRLSHTLTNDNTFADMLHLIEMDKGHSSSRCCLIASQRSCCTTATWSQ